MKIVDDYSRTKLLKAVERGDVDEVTSLVKSEQQKKSFKDWLFSLTNLFEVHLVVKLCGIKIIDFKVPKDCEA